MRRFNLPLVLATAAAAASYPPTTGLAASPAEAAVHTPPARIEPIAGSTVKRITLTERAARRLDVQTEEVRQDASGEKAVPYASVLYDLAGKAWVYTNSAPLVFVRHPVAIARVNGATAYLKEGPPVGTHVVTVGVAQLYGAEKGIGH
jgi:hypothetical protein